MNLLCLDTVDSTNAFLLRKTEAERVGEVAFANEQTAGKGMGTNAWESQPGLNLTFSMGVDMSFLRAADQFLLSQAVPIGLLDVLDPLLMSSVAASEDALSVKWPNDLLYNGRKLCGILINSTIHGMDMGVSVIGIGLNVNQMQFKDWPTDPVSLRMILQRELELLSLLEQIVAAVASRIELLKTPSGIERIQQEYLRRLYRYHVWADYLENGQVVRRFIIGLDPFGRLKTLDESGTEHTYDIKELKFLRNSECGMRNAE